ncbi:14930_t:CDS:2 [Cetraspora pellucida]|uniref:14930_t:CDS:1 n=1 Tax=Cetraspora pellucida TaxID=1433469 RepID=A0A9N9P321_9GLOM|nr:14930_t:CDS:2 [Cetraspora pellucida]
MGGREGGEGLTGLPRDSLGPFMTDNGNPPRITATAGTSWLDQGCPHCPKFPTAADPRSGGPCFSATVTDYPFRPAMVHRLGRPLPPPTIYSNKGPSSVEKLPFTALNRS